MGTSDFFAHKYADARSKFLNTSQSVGAILTQQALPNYRGPNGEALFIDVAQLGAVSPKRLLILISGTHGVEGFCGSGCQVGYLADRVYQALPADAGVMLIHALNPFGFAWLRRVNEANVDLNRNFQDFNKSLPSSAGYEAFHEYLVPQEWEGDEHAKAEVALQKYIVTNGMKTFQAELTKGQYTRPAGLFYGGREASWSNRVLREIVTEKVTETVKRLAILDIHTGLGKPGFGEPIYVGPTSEGYAIAKKWYGEEVKSTMQGTSVSAAITGSVADAFPPSNPDLEINYLALEFGTVSSIEVLSALRADHWLHAVPNRDTPLRDKIMCKIRDAFYLDVPWWKAAVYGRAVDFAIRATQALSAI
jgi:Protein of unknown function (DUF2817)